MSDHSGTKKKLGRAVGNAGLYTVWGNKVTVFKNLMRIISIESCVITILMSGLAVHFAWLCPLFEVVYLQDKFALSWISYA